MNETQRKIALISDTIARRDAVETKQSELTKLLIAQSQKLRAGSKPQTDKG